MLGKGISIYRETRKKHDLLFNLYVMRPIAAQVVALIAPSSVTPNQVTLINLAMFIAAGGLFIALPDWRGGLIGVAMLEGSYCLDCVDGMLARHKKIASPSGALFDFFTDEMKAIILASALGIRLWRSGGYGIDAQLWPSGSPWFLIAGIAACVIVASALSLTNFVRRPELTGKVQSAEAHYEANAEAKATSPVRRIAQLVTTFLRFLNHYPSHLWLFALLGRLDAFFWMYIALNSLYLARGWLGIILRFGHTPKT